MGQIAEAHPVILFRHRDAVQPELTHLWPEVAREGVALVNLGGARRYDLLAEGLDLLGQGAEGFIHQGMHPCSPWFVVLTGATLPKKEG
ncbi:hypothetical protein D3C85_565040 [compost metagenome]